MKIVKGDIIDLSTKGEFDVLVYECNCFHTPKTILSKKIRETFPQAKFIDKYTTKGGKNKLGTYSYATIDLREFDYKLRKKLTIVNSYLYFSREDPLFDYKNLESILCKLKKDFEGKKIAFPPLGLGVKDISITKICDLIDKNLEGFDYCMVIDAE